MGEGLYERSGWTVERLQIAGTSRDARLAFLDTGPGGDSVEVLYTAARTAAIKERVQLVSVA